MSLAGQGRSRPLDGHSNLPKTWWSRNRIGSIVRLSPRSEFMSMVEVTSSDVALQFEETDTVSDGTMATGEYWSDGLPPSGGKIELWGRRKSRFGKGYAGDWAKIDARKFGWRIGWFWRKASWEAEAESNGTGNIDKVKRAGRLRFHRPFPQNRTKPVYR